MNKSFVTLVLEAILTLWQMGCFYNVYMGEISGTFGVMISNLLMGEIGESTPESWGTEY